MSSVGATCECAPGAVISRGSVDCCEAACPRLDPVFMNTDLSPLPLPARSPARLALTGLAGPPRRALHQVTRGAARTGAASPALAGRQQPSSSFCARYCGAAPHSACPCPAHPAAMQLAPRHRHPATGPRLAVRRAQTPPARHRQCGARKP
jgi:hypothetical protein